MLSDDKVAVPSQLSPEDLDWEKSKPLRPWPIGPQPGEPPSFTYARLVLHKSVDRTIRLIEVRKSDVTRVLCSHEDSFRDQQTIAIHAPRLGTGAKTRGIEQAITELWPDGVPKGLIAKERDEAIVEWLRERKLSIPTNPARAIQRVLKGRGSS